MWIRSEKCLPAPCLPSAARGLYVCFTRASLISFQNRPRACEAACGGQHGPAFLPAGSAGWGHGGRSAAAPGDVPAIVFCPSRFPRPKHVIAPTARLGERCPTRGKAEKGSREICHWSQEAAELLTRKNQRARSAPPGPAAWAPSIRIRGGGRAQPAFGSRPESGEGRVRRPGRPARGLANAQTRDAISQTAARPRLGLQSGAKPHQGPPHLES